MTTKVSLGERLARFAAIDGFSINAITKPNQNCELLRYKGYTKPNSKTDVMNLTYKYYMEIVEENKRKILEVKEKKCKLSIDFDKYLKHGRRFMNINLHFNKGFVNLGLERMLGSHNSNDCLQLLIKKLGMFNVFLVCITTTVPLM